MRLLISKIPFFLISLQLFKVFPKFWPINLSLNRSKIKTFLQIFVSAPELSFQNSCPVRAELPFYFSCCQTLVCLGISHQCYPNYFVIPLSTILSCPSRIALLFSCCQTLVCLGISHQCYPNYFVIPLSTILSCPSRIALLFSCCQTLVCLGISQQCYPNYFVIPLKFLVFTYLARKIGLLHLPY